MFERPILKPGPKGSAAASAEQIAHKLCAYTRQPCDCKFGVVACDGPRSSEHGSGCPELSEIAAVLAGMTEIQYRAAYKRGIKLLAARKTKLR